MAPDSNDYSNQKLDKDGLFHVDVRQPDGATMSFTVPLNDVLGISDRQVVTGQTGFFTSNLINDPHLDPKDPWKLRYNARSEPGKNDWQNNAFDLLPILDFDNDSVAIHQEIRLHGKPLSTFTTTTANDPVTSDEPKDASGTKAEESSAGDQAATAHESAAADAHASAEAVAQESAAATAHESADVNAHASESATAQQAASATAQQSASWDAHASAGTTAQNAAGATAQQSAGWNAHASESATAQQGAGATAQQSAGWDAHASAGATAQNSAGATAQQSAGWDAHASEGATAQQSVGATAQQSAGWDAHASAGATAQNSVGATAQQSAGWDAHASEGVTAQQGAGVTAQQSAGWDAHASAGATAQNAAGATAQQSAGWDAHTSEGATAQQGASVTAQQSAGWDAHASAGATAQNSVGATAQQSASWDAHASEGATAQQGAGVTAQQSAAWDAHAAAGATAQQGAGVTAQQSAGWDAHAAAGATAQQGAGVTAQQSAGWDARAAAGATAQNSAGAIAQQSAGWDAHASESANAHQAAGIGAQASKSASTQQSAGWQASADTNVKESSGLGAQASQGAGFQEPAVPRIGLAGAKPDEPAVPRIGLAGAKPDERAIPRIGLAGGGYRAINGQGALERRGFAYDGMIPGLPRDWRGPGYGGQIPGLPLDGRDPRLPGPWSGRGTTFDGIASVAGQSSSMSSFMQSSTVTSTQQSGTVSGVTSESRTAEERYNFEERLRQTEARLAEQSRTMSSGLLNITKAYGDYDYLNTEIKKRDTQMALLLEDQADIYRELSLARQRFSSMDVERSSVTVEQTRSASQFSAIRGELHETTMKLQNLMAEYSKQELLLKQITESRTTVEHERTTLQIETDRLRKELLVVQSQNNELRAASGAVRAELEEARTTITANSVIIKQFESWKALYMGQVQTMKKELFETTEVMTRLEETYQETLRAFRKIQIEKEELQSTLILTKSSQTEVDARISILEQALQDTRTELWRVSQAYTAKIDEFDGISTTKAELERRISELTLSFAHERNVTRSLSERLLQIQGSMSTSLDWIYDMRHELSQDASYTYMDQLRSRGSIGFGLDAPSLPRLPSYGSAIRGEFDVKREFESSETKTSSVSGFAGAATVGVVTGSILGASMNGIRNLNGPASGPNGSIGPIITSPVNEKHPPGDDIKLAPPIFKPALPVAPRAETVAH
ncbi:hypothetical protein DACRYDRAFT_117752 [Dacryopinax primogenitus]|uniref:Uncharacterized protein n=1 Tax=Dacryopinax primogenitus (strain DJM 731) TaxID=1858805 RepID=M5FR38_DACPD|nr:uncharacterized protein DACRYDRAFT_117752 [Dacryopinax primogenitus]EJT99520.1 hypothetical protein DACRYDRAFT_117752 [Dacryopinax primogenitus]